MINIKEVQKIRRELVEKDYSNNLVRLDEEIDIQEKGVIKIHDTKKKAEEEFPEVLRVISNRIKRAIEIRDSNISFTFASGSLLDTCTISMLISGMSLNGFMCRLRENRLDISW